MVLTIGGKQQTLRDCPVNLLTPSVRQMLGLYGAWTDRVMWCAGGLRDQPAKYVKAMRLIGAGVAEIRAERRTKDA